MFKNQEIEKSRSIFIRGLVAKNVIITVGFTKYLLTLRFTQKTWNTLRRRGKHNAFVKFGS